MKLNMTGIEGCYEMLPMNLKDHRGRFVKPYHQGDFKELGLDLVIREEYYSVSRKNVIRGLHFQLPPKATKKLVTCLDGIVLDAVVDLRKNSPNYLEYFTIELSEEKGNLLFIPEGLAHGFCALSEEATVLYMCSEVYSPDHDTGIRWDSAGITWPAVNPVISEKDRQLIPLELFNTPFT